MSKTVTITITVEQAIALRRASEDYANDSGRDDADLACSALDQIPEEFFNK